MSEEPKSFNVRDRRHFTADGEARVETAMESAESTPSPPVADASGVQAESEAEGGAVSLAGFLLSLGAQGLEALGATPPALTDARAMVSILEMLKDKTEGRRTTEENDVLEGVLYQLRMGYVQRSQVSSS